MSDSQTPSISSSHGLFARLARDAAGNTLAIVAASIAPILAMVGGGIDMGRSYLAESRLQQACDAGVLAARKKLGSAAVVTGQVPSDVSEVGERFFNINYRVGAYGTENRQFTMTLDNDYSISGTATVDVPTTIMGIFGFTNVAVAAECQARLNFSNTDVMMVLDTTGSMAQTNPGDAVSKIAALKATVTAFFLQIAASTKPGNRVRYGFVPYSTNVNVGGLLKDEWVVKDWSYQSRTLNTGAIAGGLYTYKPVARNVADWRTASNGCIEERKTYEIADYDNVDLGRAMDLDIDLVPAPGNTDSQWRPMYPLLVYDRAIKWDGSGSFSSAAATTSSEYLNPGLAGYAACPPAARKLEPFSLTSLTSYLSSLQPRGSTYHDIGMIWGGRLLSPTGIFADENADVPGKPTSRNLIFLTDGETAPLDVSYASYGVEPLEKKRWSAGSARSLTQTVEARFAFACKEVRKKNITVWLIAFGTKLNPALSDCAGPGHTFEASDSAKLSQAFDDIARSIGDLRVSR